MNIYIDIRCLQDKNYNKRGIGNHTLSIIKNARKFLDKSYKIVGLVDNYNYPLLEYEYKPYFDSFTSSFSEVAQRLTFF